MVTRKERVRRFIHGEEKQMFKKLFSKKTLKTKAFWAGVINFAAGAYLVVSGKDVVAGASLMGLGSGVITLRDAISKAIRD